MRCQNCGCCEVYVCNGETLTVCLWCEDGVPCPGAQRKRRDRLIRMPAALKAVVKKKHEHGTRACYVTGCRCVLCRRANCQYQLQREKEQRRGEWTYNGLVSADAARKHLMKLSKQGVGRRTVASITALPQSSIAKIRSGTKRHIRAKTEQAILKVSRDAAHGAALIDAAPTWRIINRLLGRGMSKRAIAKALGYAQQLQLNKNKITAFNALKVRAFAETFVRAARQEVHPC